MPKKDDSFIALGPLKKTEPAFRTYGTNIFIGAEIKGNDIGIIARCDKGLAAISATGGKCPAIVAESTDRSAIEAISTKNDGVRGATRMKSKAGVVGTGLAPNSDGVFGQGGAGGRGGVFRSSNEENTMSAQIRLIPGSKNIFSGKPQPANPDEYNSTKTSRLPSKGDVGDLLAVQNQDGDTSLWLCIEPNRVRTPAQWRQVLLGTPVSGGS